MNSPTKLSLVAALGLTLATPVSAETVLRMSSWAPSTSDLVTELLTPWTEAVSKATEGRVTIQTMPNALGAPAQHYELARKGIADVTWGNLTYEPDRFKSVWFAEFPLSGGNGEAASAALWETYQTHLKDLPVFDGTHMLATGLLGGGSIHHSSKALDDPEDFANEKIRMGGPIQKRLLEEMGAIPVAGPATKAYELVDGGVIDGSLHPLESVLGFHVEDKLTNHTIVDEGFYDGFFFVVINERSWQRISEEDRAAIEEVSGEVFSRQWGAFFDRQNAEARVELEEMGHTFVTPSPALQSKIEEVRATMLSEWATEGVDFDLPNAQEVVDFYEASYEAKLMALQEGQ